MAARHLLDSAQARNAADFDKIKYSWVDVQQKSDKELANLFIKRTQAAVDLLSISLKPGYNPAKRAEVRVRLEKATPNLGVILQDFED